jgi:hypothetical protein
MDYKMIYLAQRNPAVAPQAWPRAWRSHAAYAATFPVLGAQIKGLFYCSRIFDPTLGGEPAILPGASRDHDGVAVVSSPHGVEVGGTLAPEDRARILEDELRVFRVHTPNFTFRCEEVLVEGGSPGPAAVFRFLARRPQDSPETFLARWTAEQAPLAIAAATRSGGLVRYVHDRMREPPPPGYPFDGISEAWFATTEDAVRFAARETGPDLDHLASLCDPARSVALATQVIHGWPKPA